MADSRFEEKLIPSKRLAPGTWLVTRCIEKDDVIGIDLGWKDTGADRSYRHVGSFQHESETLFAINSMETLQTVNDIGTTISVAGFTKHDPAGGFSHGNEPYVRRFGSGKIIAVLAPDDVNGTRLYLEVIEGGKHRTVEIATLQLDTDGTKLASLGRPHAVETAVLCALLEARIAAGDPCQPCPSPLLSLVSSS